MRHRRVEIPERIKDFVKFSACLHNARMKLESPPPPQDAPLLAAHLEALEREGAHISRVYRLVLPAPHYTVHVMTKSRVFRPNPNIDFKGKKTQLLESVVFKKMN